MGPVAKGLEEVICGKIEGAEERKMPQAMDEERR